MYPHNLHYMFARVYMEDYGNLPELADLTGAQFTGNEQNVYPRHWK